MAGLAGVTPMEIGVAAVTDTVVEPDTVPSVALTVTAPRVRAVPSPSYPEALLTASTVGSELFQSTVRVRSCVE